MVFFVSWQLWEQLTFVLAMSLCAVFVAGYVKLWWITRRVRMHALGDEEKKMRVQEMRQSGNIVEVPEEEPIPFGVRALEKGVEVDGIWISKKSTPIPEHLRIGRYVKRKSNSSDFSFISKAGAGGTASSKSSLSLPPGRRVLSAFGLASPSTENAPDMLFPSDGVADSLARRAYQPRRSSQLRYSSYNDVEYDADTLGRLEGNIPMKDDVKVRRPRGAGPEPGTGTTTENERSSGSFTSSDGTLNPQADIPRNTSPYLTAGPYVPTGSQQQGEYFAISAPRTPAGPPSAANPFSTPDHTPSNSDTSSKHMSTPSTHHTVVEPSAGEFELPLLESHSREASPERAIPPPNFQHANRATRHVNSGFSVLPAGTFGTAEPKGKEVERPSTRDSQNSQNSQVSRDSRGSLKKKANKLQKKLQNRFSMSGPRRSEDLS